MHSRTRLLAFVVTALATPATSTVASAALHPGTVAERPSDPPDSARIKSLLQKADAAMFGGKLGEARSLYRQLINEQRDAQQYEREALWRLVNSYLMDDDISSAASVLDELAQSAARYGDPSMELTSTFEAAVYHQRLKRPVIVAEHVTRIKALLQSPAITAHEREDYARRLVVK